MILAIDFDGTIVKHMFPLIGPFRKNAINVLKRLYDEGHTLLIWTCRTEEEHIKPAKDALAAAGIRYHGFNTNAPEMTFNPHPKIYGDVYIDDRQLGGIPEDWEDIYKMLQMYNYQKRR